MGKAVVEFIADYLRLSTAEVVEIIDRAPTSYRRYEIPKKRGGTRTIFHPAKETKAVQYALLDLFFRHLDVHSAAAGYVRGIKHPTKRNALRHAKYQYSVRIDCRDFFPSIRPDDFWIASADQLLALGIRGDKSDRDAIAGACFLKQPRTGVVGLAVGSPSSPAISNVVMAKFDAQFTDVARHRGAEYSRYADDLVFSSNKQGECRILLHEVTRCLDAAASPHLEVNKKKTAFMSRGNRRIINGLVVTPQGNVTIGRKNKRYARKLLYLLSEERISEKERRYLQGYLGFMQSVEPGAINQFVLKYGASIVASAIDYRWTPNASESPASLIEVAPLQTTT